MRTLASKLTAAAALALLAGAASGEEKVPSNRERMTQLHRAWVAAGKPQPAALTPKFGVDAYETVNVHAYAFQGNTTSDVIQDDGNGYRYFGAAGLPFMAAPVQLPTGASIVGLGMSACTSQPGDLAIALFDNVVGGEGSGGGNLIGNLQAGEGCQTIVTNIPPYTYYANLFHPLYLVIWFASNPLDGTVKFNDVVVYFRRQVSISPKIESFGDVPLSDPAFAHIEALVYSGVTAGCAPTLYCPDDFVTRRQMAVFLAKALGLHWLL